MPLERMMSFGPVPERCGRRSAPPTNAARMSTMMKMPPAIAILSREPEPDLLPVAARLDGYSELSVRFDRDRTGEPGTG